MGGGGVDMIKAVDGVVKLVHVSSTPSIYAVVVRGLQDSSHTYLVTGALALVLDRLPLG